MPQHERLDPGIDEMDYSVAGFFEEEEIGGTVLGMLLKWEFLRHKSAKRLKFGWAQVEKF